MLLSNMDREYDLFTCRECGTSVYSHPAQDPPPTLCSNCWHLDQCVDDPVERLACKMGAGPQAARVATRGASFIRVSGRA
jgi:hypothetical protein